MCQEQNQPCHNDQVYGQKPAMEKNHKSKLGMSKIYKNFDLPPF
jgi:hypothetical protein